MRITETTRTPEVTVYLRFQDAEPVVLSDGTKVHPVSMRIVYRDDTRRSYWTMSTFKYKVDGTVGKATKDVAEHDVTGWSWDAQVPVPQWITDLVEAHRPRVDLATV